MKLNTQSTKYSRKYIMQTSEIIFQPSCQLVSMTFLQTGSNDQAQSVLMQRYRQNQSRLIFFQTKKKIKSSQVNNAVR